MPLLLDAWWSSTDVLAGWLEHALTHETETELVTGLRSYRDYLGSEEVKAYIVSLRSHLTHHNLGFRTDARICRMSRTQPSRNSRTGSPTASIDSIVMGSRTSCTCAAPASAIARRCSARSDTRTGRTVRSS